MKIHNGFISNSSSSSFIILLNDNNRHLAHYKWKVLLQEIVTDNWSGDYQCQGYKRNLSYEEELKLQYDFYKEEDVKVWEKTTNINIIPKDTGMDRTTGIALKKDIVEFLDELEKSNYKIAFVDKVREYIKKYGLENIMLIRESDECMGGYLPEELQNLTETKDVLCEAEYH